MEFLRGVLGAPPSGAQPSPAETVERLVDRLNNSTLLEDRRDACRGLKALSRTYRIEVGVQGLDSLMRTIELDRADCETVGLALDAVRNVVSEERFEEETRSDPVAPVDVGDQFTEVFLKDRRNAKTVLELLEEYDYRVRLPAVRLLGSLLANRPKDLQEIVLVSPMGVSKLMDLLADGREVVRNDALLLLVRLTRGNSNIQKIVAFENAFDRLFDVIAAEGFSDGGIVVEDCLLLMLNLLKNNSSNQSFFKEGGYVQRLLPAFETADADENGWSPQKASNVHCALQVVRALVSPQNPAGVVSGCQKIMKAVRLLDALCDTLMISGVPTDILTETINTVGEVVRGDPVNQEYLSSVVAPSDPPRPAIVVLLMSMVNEKQPFSLRCAVVYCFQCYLYRNDGGQARLVQTLLPSTSELSELTPGRLLCGGLFSPDALSNWFSAVSLMHALVDSPSQKEQLLRVLLATEASSFPVSLLGQCTTLLQQGTKLHSKVAFLMLLSVWSSQCPRAVASFLAIPGAVGYLVSQICSNEHDDNEYLLQGMCAFLMALCFHFNDDSVESYTKDGLRQLLIKRIGLETFVAKLGEVSKHEMYSRAAKQPQIRARGMGELLLDYQYCKLVKNLESTIIGELAVQSDGGGAADEAREDDGPDAEETPLLPQYKNLIRQQDAKLQELTAQIERLSKKAAESEVILKESIAANAQLKDENTLLRARLAADAPSIGRISDSANGPLQAETERRIADLESQIVELKERLMRNEGELGAANTALSERSAELERLKADQDDLLELLAHQDTELTQHKTRLRELGQSVDENEEN